MLYFAPITERHKNMADKRLTDATGTTIGFLCDSAGRKTVTDAHGSLKGYYDSVNDKTFTANGGLVGSGDLQLKLLPIRC